MLLSERFPELFQQPQQNPLRTSPGITPPNQVPPSSQMRSAPVQPTGFWDAISNAASRGWNTDDLWAAMEDQDYGLMAREAVAIHNAPPSAEFKRIFEPNNGTDNFSSFIRGLFEHPLETLQAFAEMQIEQVARDTWLYPINVGVPLLTGVIGGGVGSAVPAVGTAAGYVGGRLAGTFATSFVTSHSRNQAAKLQELLEANGVNLEDPDSIRAAFSDEQTIAQLQQKANKYGLANSLTESFFNTISMGIPVFKAMSGKPIAEALKTIPKLSPGQWATMQVLENVGGGAGEAVGMWSIDQKVSPYEVMAEVVGDVGMTAIKTGIEQVTGAAQATMFRSRMSAFDRNEQTRILNERYRKLGNDINANPEQAEELFTEFTGELSPDDLNRVKSNWDSRYKNLPQDQRPQFDWMSFTAAVTGNKNIAEVINQRNQVISTTQDLIKGIATSLPGVEDPTSFATAVVDVMNSISTGMGQSLEQRLSGTPIQLRPTPWKTNIADGSQILGEYTTKQEAEKTVGLIDLFRGSNPSTIIDELTHYLLSNLSDEDKQRVAKSIGKPEGSTLTVDDEQAVANAIIIKLHSGKSTLPGLDEAFGKVSESLRRVYKSLDKMSKKLGIDTNISPEIREFLDNTFSDESVTEQKISNQADIIASYQEAFSRGAKKDLAKRDREAYFTAFLFDAFARANDMSLEDFLKQNNLYISHKDASEAPGIEGLTARFMNDQAKSTIALFKGRNVRDVLTKSMQFFFSKARPEIKGVIEQHIGKSMDQFNDQDYAKLTNEMLMYFRGQLSRSPKDKIDKALFVFDGWLRSVYPSLKEEVDPNVARVFDQLFPADIAETNRVKNMQELSKALKDTYLSYGGKPQPISTIMNIFTAISNATGVSLDKIFEHNKNFKVVSQKTYRRTKEDYATRAGFNRTITLTGQNDPRLVFREVFAMYFNELPVETKNELAKLIGQQTADDLKVEDKAKIADYVLANLATGTTGSERLAKTFNDSRVIFSAALKPMLNEDAINITDENRAVLNSILAAEPPQVRIGDSSDTLKGAIAAIIPSKIRRKVSDSVVALLKRHAEVANESLDNYLKEHPVKIVKQDSADDTPANIYIDDDGTVVVETNGRNTEVDMIKTLFATMFEGIDDDMKGRFAVAAVGEGATSQDLTQDVMDNIQNAFLKYIKQNKAPDKALADTFANLSAVLAEKSLPKSEGLPVTRGRPIRQLFDEMFKKSVEDKNISEERVEISAENVQTEQARYQKIPINQNSTIEELQNFLAEEQRGQPEEIMNKISKRKISPIYSWYLEHIGDLTNRLASPGSYASVSKKVRMALNYLKDPNEIRHIQEQVNDSIKEGRTTSGEIEQLGKEYADAHRKLVTYNDITSLAKDAAIAVGEMDFESVIEKLKEIQGYIENENNWDKTINRVDYDILAYDLKNRNEIEAQVEQPRYQKVPLTSQEQEWIDKNYIPETDVPLFRIAQKVIDKLNELFNFYTRSNGKNYSYDRIVIHPKRRPLIENSPGVFYTEKGEVTFSFTYKYSDGTWAKTDVEQAIKTFTHEIGHAFYSLHGETGRVLDEFMYKHVNRYWDEAAEELGYTRDGKELSTKVDNKPDPRYQRIPLSQSALKTPLDEVASVDESVAGNLSQQVDGVIMRDTVPVRPPDTLTNIKMWFKMFDVTWLDQTNTVARVDRELEKIAPDDPRLKKVMGYGFFQRYLKFATGKLAAMGELWFKMNPVHYNGDRILDSYGIPVRSYNEIGKRIPIYAKKYAAEKGISFKEANEKIHNAFNTLVSSHLDLVNIEKREKRHTRIPTGLTKEQAIRNIELINAEFSYTDENGRTVYELESIYSEFREFARALMKFLEKCDPGLRPVIKKMQDDHGEWYLPRISVDVARRAIENQTNKKSRYTPSITSKTILDDEIDGIASIARDVGIEPSILKKITGSTDGYIPYTYSTLIWMHKVLQFGMQRFVYGGLTDFFMEDTKAANEYFPIATAKGEIPTGADSIEGLKKQLIDFGINPDNYSEKEMRAFAASTITVNKEGGDYVLVGDIVDGKSVYRKVPKSFIEAIQVAPRPNRASYGMIKSILAFSNRLVRMGATTFRVSFNVWTNLLRDPGNFTKTMSGASPQEIAAAWFQAMHESMQFVFSGGRIKSPLIELWMNSGLFMGTKTGQDIMRTNEYDETYGFQTLGGVAKNKGERFFNVLREFLSVSDAPTRLAEFKLMIDKHDRALAPDDPKRIVQKDGSYRPFGFDEFNEMFVATTASREISIDFQSGGSQALEFNQISPFFNPAIQGPRLAVKFLKDAYEMAQNKNDAKIAKEGKMRIAKFFTLGLVGFTMPAIALFTGYKKISGADEEDDWWERMPDWRKYGYMHLAVGKDQVISVPVDQTLGTIFYSIPMMLMDFATNHRTAGSDVAKGLRYVFDQLSPLESDLFAIEKAGGEYGFDEVKFGGALAGLNPLTRFGWELASGREVGTGRRIIPEELAIKAPQYRVTDFTSWYAKALASVIPVNVSPIYVDHFIKRMSAGLFDSVAALQRVSKEGFGVTALKFLGILSQPGRTGFSSVYVEEMDQDIKYLQSLQNLTESQQEYSAALTIAANAIKALRSERYLEKTQARLIELREREFDIAKTTLTFRPANLYAAGRGIGDERTRNRNELNRIANQKRSSVLWSITEELRESNPGMSAEDMTEAARKDPRYEAISAVVRQAQNYSILGRHEEALAMVRGITFENLRFNASSVKKDIANTIVNNGVIAGKEHALDLYRSRGIDATWPQIVKELWGSFPEFNRAVNRRRNIARNKLPDVVVNQIEDDVIRAANAIDTKDNDSYTQSMQHVMQIGEQYGVNPSLLSRQFKILVRQELGVARNAAQIAEGIER